jgi:DNA-binding response OmpR family regulator
MTLSTPTSRSSARVPNQKPAPVPASREPTYPSTSTPAVLVVEDDRLTRRVLHELLDWEGYAVHAVADGPAALAHLDSHHVDLVVLDRGLPGVNGLEVCRRARAGLRGKSLRIIMLMGLDDPEHILDGFDAGADDYVAKPYSPRELLARVRANLRRKDLARVDQVPLLVVDERLQIDFNEQEVTLDGQRIRLGRTEFALLRVLVENAGQVVPFATILTQVWGPAYTDAPNYVHLYITYLRRKIERDPGAPRYVHSERGVGYRFQSGDGPRGTRASVIEAEAHTRSDAEVAYWIEKAGDHQCHALRCLQELRRPDRARLSPAETRTRRDRAVLSLVGARRAVLRAQAMVRGTEDGSTLQGHLAQLDALIRTLEQECAEPEAR